MAQGMGWPKPCTSWALSGWEDIPIIPSLRTWSKKPIPCFNDSKLKLLPNYGFFKVIGFPKLEKKHLAYTERNSKRKSCEL